ncbi:MAG: tRNA (adenosine(37)-N6)-threonylcarbamoyltransferase complex ATPase subunit type 1 TsaE [Roseburia sp.]|nr:tRNA (adenosine(37)-N6)-threonylcarbamoyltransferase complex ATPase subunit type 1 TsaE [Roseburia sp.]
MVESKKRDRRSVKAFFTAKNITRMSVFTVLAYILYMPIFEFSLIPAVPFLKVDFSNAFVMIAGFAMGPIAAVVVGILKELLHALTFSQTVGVGELANIIIMLPYVIIPSVFYARHKNIKTVFITLAVGCVLQGIWSIPVNYILTFPFFLMAYAGASTWRAGMDFYLTVWYWAVLFNFVKTLLVSGAVLLLYKHFQRLFRYIFDGERRRTDMRGGKETYTADSPEQMEKLGERLAKTLSVGDVVLLTGELGAGKTVLCKGIAKGLEVKEQVVSPTFTLMNEYFGRVKFCHFDAYRLESADEATEAGLAEYIGAPDCICAIEWWENISALTDGCKTIKIDVKKCGDDRRELTVER